MSQDTIIRPEEHLDRMSAHLLERVQSDDSALEVFENEHYRWLQSADGDLHSVMDKRSPERLVLPYTTTMMAALLFMDAPRSVLMLGLGGASQARFLRHHFPQASITAWEQSAGVIATARRGFGIEPDDDHLHVVNTDARAVMDFDGPPADLMLLDLFGAGGMSPWMHASGIYTSCLRRLAGDGVMAANLWIDSDEELLAVLNGVQQAFAERILLVAVPGYRNFIVLGFAATPRLDFSHLRERARDLGARTGIDFHALLERMRESNYSDASGFVL